MFTKIKEGRFTVKYPNDWWVFEGLPDLGSPYSDAQGIADVSLGAPGSVGAGDVDVYADVIAENILEKSISTFKEDALNAAFAGAANFPTDESNVVVDGQAGVKVIVRETFRDADGTPDQVSRSGIFIVKNRRIFTLEGNILLNSPETQKADQILSTFRFWIKRCAA